jgi:endonuclease-3
MDHRLVLSSKVGFGVCLTLPRCVRQNEPWRAAAVPSYTRLPLTEFTTTQQEAAVVAKADARRHAAKVVRALKKDYPDATCALNFETPLQLLIATILSAQCTDQRVNQVTREVFKKYKTAADFAHARLPTLERAIQSTGFFRNKAKAIKGCCEALAEQHDGSVPEDLDTLVELPGVGRKTANVVLGTAYGIPSGVVVDTHVARITQRLGLTRQTDPVKIERDLCDVLPRTQWIDFSHRMIHHGRSICTARNPKCDDCSMDKFCPRKGVKTKKRKQTSTG